MTFSQKKKFQKNLDFCKKTCSVAPVDQLFRYFLASVYPKDNKNAHSNHGGIISSIYGYGGHSDLLVRMLNFHEVTLDLKLSWMFDGIFNILNFRFKKFTFALFR